MESIMKFRVWDKKDKVMLGVKGYDEVKKVFNCYRYYNPKNEHITIYVPKDNSILMWYIRFKDKNNKEVYEKDIIKDKKGDKWIIQWNDVEFCYDVVLIGKIECWKHLSDLLSENEGDVEVIGNIYENPELLE